MPKTEIDYSNTIIYKIVCKDPSITDLYVGHTTNFVQRKHAHKNGCINEKSTNYNCKLYKTIRTNGGWDNWIMEIVTFFKCNDHYEARIKEQEFFTSLNATLNSIEPLPKPKSKLIDAEINEPVLNKKIYFCETCNVTLQSAHLLAVHNQTKKHCKKKPATEINVQKSSDKFCCEHCHYSTSRQSQYERHILTYKHKKITYDDETSYAKIPKSSENYYCDCGKEYKHRQGLWKHRKTCKTDDGASSDTEKINTAIYNQPTDKDLIMMLIKENSELKTMMMEHKNMLMKVIENGTNNSNSQN